jgi:hypothetical protein
MVDTVLSLAVGLWQIQHNDPGIVRSCSIRNLAASLRCSIQNEQYF